MIQPIGRGGSLRGSTLAGLAASSTLLAVASWFLLVPAAPPGASRVTLTGGNAAGLRHRIAQHLASLTSAEKFQVTVQPTDGSVAALDAVLRGEVDLALVQGGLKQPGGGRIGQVMSLQVEPLHLLVEQSIPASTDPLATLRGKSVAVGSGGSGTEALATEVMRLAGYRAGRDYNASGLSYQQIGDAIDREEPLPAAIWTLSSLPSPIATRLIRERNYRLVDLPLSEAFAAAAWLDNENSPVAFQRIVQAQIPARVYRVDPPAPDHDVLTIGTRLLLVARDDLPAQRIRPVVDAIVRSDRFGLRQSLPSVEELHRSSEYPLHPATEAYLRRRQPVSSGDLIAVTEQCLAIAGAVFGGGLFFWQAVALVRRRRRDRQFLDCIEKVVTIDDLVVRYETGGSVGVEDLVRAQRELAQIKAQMIAQFRSGQIEGADALSAVLKHAGDAGENLTRLILHERRGPGGDSPPTANRSPSG